MDETLGKESLQSMMLEVNERRVPMNTVVDYLSKKGLEFRSSHEANHLFLRKS